jgi:hypothetical protein
MTASSGSVTLGWKIVLVVLGIVALSSGLVKKPGFWSSYVLDMAGPAWIYILLRCQYSSRTSTFMSLRFSPEGAFFLVFGIGVLIETSQYFKLYEATFDPYDYVAYLSLLLPCFLLDKHLQRRQNRLEKV